MSGIPQLFSNFKNMDIKNFIENFASLFTQGDSSEFSEETEFKKLSEWSSLLALSVIAMVEDEYDVLLKSTDIVGSSTIRELFDIISAQQSQA